MSEPNVKEGYCQWSDFCDWKSDYIVDEDNYENFGYESFDDVPFESTLCGGCLDQHEAGYRNPMNDDNYRHNARVKKAWKILDFFGITEWRGYVNVWGSSKGQRQ